MVEVLEPVTFSRGIEGTVSDLTVPEEFINDFNCISEEKLLIVMQIVGPDIDKAIDFFKNSTGDKFTIKTTRNSGRQISNEFILIDIESNEGPNLGVDIDIEPPKVKLMLEFEKK